MKNTMLKALKSAVVLSGRQQREKLLRMIRSIQEIYGEEADVRLHFGSKPNLGECDSNSTVVDIWFSESGAQFYGISTLGREIDLESEEVSRDELICLAVEYVYPDMYVYAEEDSEAVFLEERLVQILKKLQELFPEEDFRPVLRHRCESEKIWELDQQNGGNGQRYMAVCLTPEPEKVVEYVLKSSAQSIQNSYMDGFIENHIGLGKLDRCVPMLTLKGTRMALWVLCMHRELNSLFRLEDADDLRAAASSLNVLRNGGAAWGIRQEWSRYDLPEGVKRELMQLPLSAIGKLVQSISGASDEEMQEAFFSWFNVWQEEARAEAWKSGMQSRLDWVERIIGWEREPGSGKVRIKRRTPCTHSSI